MTIKMIAVDMDGTFLNDYKKYNVTRFNEIFQRMQEKRVRFVVASGNQYFQLRSFFPDIYKSITFVAENGANIVMGDQAFYNAELDQKAVLDTLTIVKKLAPVNLILCGKNSAYISADVSQELFSRARFYYPEIKKLRDLEAVVNEKDAIFKFALSFEASDAKEKLENLAIALGDRLTPVSSGHGDIDLIIPGVHKYHGLSLLKKEWDILDEEIAAFGDSGNDLEMIKYTKYSFAMENAQESIKAAARTIIGSNNTEAVLDTIQAILEKDKF